MERRRALLQLRQVLLLLVLALLGSLRVSSAVVVTTVMTFSLVFRGRPPDGRPTLQALDARGLDVGVFTSVTVGPNGLPLVAYTHLTDVAGVSELRLLSCGTLACNDSASTAVRVADTGGYHPSVTHLADGSHFLVSHSEATASASAVRVLVCNAAACATPATNVLPPGYVNPGWTSVSLGSNGIAQVAFAASNATHSVIGYALCADAACSTLRPTTIMHAKTGPNLFNWGSDRALQHPYVAFYRESVGLVLLVCVDLQCTPGFVLEKVLDPYRYNGDVGLYAAMALRSSDRLPVIAHHDASNLALRLVLCSDLQCDTRIVRAFPSTGGWDPSVAFDAVTGFPLVAYSDPGDNQAQLMVCGDATCDPLRVSSIAMLSAGRFEAVSVLSTAYYRPFVVAHNTLDYSMRAAMIVTDPACLTQAAYPCPNRIGVVITEPATNVVITNADTIQVSGAVTGVSDLTGITIGGGPFVLLANGTFSGLVALVPGSNTVTVHVLNGTLEVGTASITVVSDRVPPLLNITSPATNGTTVYTSTVLITGTASDAGTSVVSVATGTQLANTTSPSWSFTVSLVLGTNVVTVVATDAAGNTASQSVTIVQGGLDPRLLCPANLVLQCGTEPPAPVGARLVNCDGGSVTVLETFAPTCGATGIITREYRATGCAADVSCAQAIQMVDLVSPTVTCPASATLECATFTSATTLGQAVVGVEPMRCGNAPQLTLVISGGQLACGVTVLRTFTAQDDCGNSASCTQAVTVNAAINADGTSTTAPTTTTSPGAASGLTSEGLGALIAGIIVLLLILLVTLIAFLMWRRKQKRRHQAWDASAVAMVDDDSADVHTSQLYVDNPNSSSYDMKDIH